MTLIKPVTEIVEESTNPLLAIHPSWERVDLGLIAEVLNGYAFESRKFSKKKGFPLLRIRDIGRNTTECLYVGEYDSIYVVRRGDLIVGMDGDFNSAVWMGPEALLNQRVCKIVVNRNYYNEKFLEIALPAYLKEINKNTSSVTVKHLSSKSVAQIPLPLPPINEQCRIVSRVEELFSVLDAGVESLGKVKAQLKHYRQAVLKYAFEGKLTEEWRKTHKYQIEPAQKLLERIKQEGKKRASVKYEEPSPEDPSQLPKLPEEWIWTKSGILSWFVTSGSRNWKQYYSNSGPLFIRTENINKNKLSLENIAHVSLPERVEGKRSLVERNDILIIITGANVGKVALVDKEIGEAYVSQSVALMKLVMPEIARFVHFAMIANGFGKTELNKMVYGMGRPVLSLKNVQEISLPLAPLLEQEKIVEEIERRLSVVDEIEKTVEKNLKAAELLRQSVLERAFEGKLVPQDPTDEPAEKLLERIKEEKARLMFKEHMNKKKVKRKTPKQIGLMRYVE